MGEGPLTQDSQPSMAGVKDDEPVRKKRRGNYYGFLINLEFNAYEQKNIAIN